MRRRAILFTVLALASLTSGRVHATSPAFTLAPGSPTLPVVPATPDTILVPAGPPVLGPVPPPVVGLPAAALGLVAGDVITSISFGAAAPFPLVPPAAAYFSVDPGTIGVPIVPPPPNVSCEMAGGALQAESDVFASGPAIPIPNMLSLDGTGIVETPCGPPPSPGIGLLEPPVGGDDVFALEMCSTSTVFTGAAITLPVYLTLGPGSPTLAAIPATSADLLVVAPPGFALPAIAMPFPALGLVAADVIDAVSNLGLGLVYFSLAPFSPTLGICGLSAADVIVGPGPACLWPAVVPAVVFGLLPIDNIDALSVMSDPDMDFVGAMCDNCPTVPNNAQLDADADGVGDVCDNCPTIANAAQTNSDTDLLGDACDSCTLVANPTVTPLAFQTVTGGQLDDDADGYGQQCDGDFNQAKTKVDAADLDLFKVAFAKARTGATCDPGGTSPCDKYDLNNSKTFIDAADLAVFKVLFSLNKGPKCLTCPLACAGDACP